MDFHDLPDGVTAAHVAQMHQADLKIEHKYNCRGLTYWCDEIRQTAFCLIEAPNAEAIRELHEKAHGGVPQRIIEVDDHIVETFLGRINDPEVPIKNGLPIIDDSAYRVLLVVDMHRTKLREEGQSTLQAALRGYAKSIKALVTEQKGRPVQQSTYRYLASFRRAEDAIKAALAIRELHNCVITPALQFRIGICAGDPVTEKGDLFEEAITKAKNLGSIAGEEVVISEEVRKLYENESHQPIPGQVRCIPQSEEQFLSQVMAYLDTVWNKHHVEAGDLHRDLGYSKSKLYRSLTKVAAASPLHLLKQYRLEKSLALLDQQTHQIAEVAYQCGFSSPAYFSKCFQEVYGVLPSGYLRTLQG